MLIEENDRDSNWDLFMVNSPWVEHNITTVQNLVENVLYYLDNRFFPLVDMYYKNKSGLVGIQATMGKEHAKKVSVCQSFYDKVGTNPETTPLKLYYLIMPCNIDHFNKDNYTLSQFWKNVQDGIAPQWKNNITFFTLLSPSSFAATMPENVEPIIQDSD